MDRVASPQFSNQYSRSLEKLQSYKRTTYVEHGTISYTLEWSGLEMIDPDGLEGQDSQQVTPIRDRTRIKLGSN